MTRTALIVGAGATVAEALPSRPPRERTPPLDASFFELVRIANLDGQATIRRYMTAQYGIDPFDGNHRMEEVFNYIYSDAFSAEPPTNCLDAYWALLRMYRTAIAHTTDELQGRSSFGIGALIRALYRRDPLGELRIITFNQDLVIEKALQNTVQTNRYSSLPWNIESCYGLEFESTISYTNRSAPFTSNGVDSIEILKLHGSLNWVYTVRSGRDPRNSLRDPGTGIRLLNDQEIRTGRQTFRAGAREIDLVPLVVPPIYEKASRHQNTPASVWGHAREVLRESDELIIFGYSFPSADFYARSMFRGCFHNNAALHEIHVVDIDPDVGSKVASIFGARCVHFYRAIPDFIRHF